jgi:hypothetical protein
LSVQNTTARPTTEFTVDGETIRNKQPIFLNHMPRLRVQFSTLGYIYEWTDWATRRGIHTRPDKIHAVARRLSASVRDADTIGQPETNRAVESDQPYR